MKLLPTALPSQKVIIATTTIMYAHIQEDVVMIHVACD